MPDYCFGVDIGGTSVKLGMFTSAGELVEKTEIPARKAELFILDDIAVEIKRLMKKHAGRYIGLGLGVPGPVRDEAVVLECVNLGWGILDVTKEMRSRIDLPIRAGNDANVAALGEMWRGAGKNHRNIVMITLGTGVGGGIIVDGKIVSGTVGAGGEIGHMPVLERDMDFCCGCGKRNCLEQVASASGLTNEARRLMSVTSDNSILRSTLRLDAKAVFDAAKLGDGLALKAVEKMGYYLGVATADIGCIINPEVFVIGGGVSLAGQIVIDLIRKHYVKMVFPRSKDTPFVLAELGNDAGIYGAAKLSMG